MVLLDANRPQRAAEVIIDPADAVVKFPMHPERERWRRVALLHQLQAGAEHIQPHTMIAQPHAGGALDVLRQVAEVQGVGAIAEFQSLPGRLGQRERLKFPPVANMDVGEARAGPADCLAVAGRVDDVGAEGGENPAAALDFVQRQRGWLVGLGRGWRGRALSLGTGGSGSCQDEGKQELNREGAETAGRLDDICS